MAYPPVRHPTCLPLSQVTIHLQFPNGLPAFEAQHQFRLVERQECQPLLFLESETNPNLSFLLLPIATIDPDYRLSLSADDREILGACEESSLRCLAVITAAEDLPPTANLLAPVVVNLAAGRAVQAVRCDTVYSHKHPLLEGASCS
jgi:flagellar assembly factor FliW